MSWDWLFLGSPRIPRTGSDVKITSGGIKVCRGNSLVLHPFFFTPFVSKSAFIFSTFYDIVPSIHRQPVQKDVTTSDTVEGYLTDTP